MSKLLQDALFQAVGDADPNAKTRGAGTFFHDEGSQLSFEGFDGKELRSAFTVQKAHCSLGMQTLHSGYMSTVADVLAGCVLAFTHKNWKRQGPAIELSIKFTGTGKLGARILTKTRILKESKSLAFIAVEGYDAKGALIFDARVTKFFVPFVEARMLKPKF